MTTTPQAIKKLAKFLEYALGRHPDEFGLLPDDQGYVKIKTLLQALHEDTEWRHLRQGHLQSLVVMQHPAPVEMTEDAIRARDRRYLPVRVTPSELPKLLYAAVRRRAYPVVLVNGVRPGAEGSVLLSPHIEMARRLGRRIDNDPVLITVQVATSEAAGTTFMRFGEHLVLADFIPAQTFSGPPLQKEKPLTAPRKTKAPPEQPKTPGSFFPDPASIENPGMPPHRRKRELEWKKDRRRQRKDKARR